MPAPLLRPVVALLLSVALLGLGPLTAAAADEPIPDLGGLIEDRPPSDDPAPQPDPEPDPEPEPVAEPAPERAPEPARPAPGRSKVILSAGDEGRAVRVLQVRLQRLDLRDVPVTGLYGKQTVKSVKRFQRSVDFARSGAVDRATHKALRKQAGKVDKADIAAGQNRPYATRLPASCLQGPVVCVDKTGRTVRWVTGGKVRMVLDARFGSDQTPTREGVFDVNFKSRDHHSRLYDTSMPFALFFDGGQAVHYSPDFASTGYTRRSHGCVNTREYNKMRKLFDRADVGDRVVVYRSRAPKG